MKDILFKNVSKSFEGRPVLEGFSARMPAGSITCLMGPSGRGKTTLLNLLLGLTAPDSGSMEGLPGSPAVVFQEDRLCPGFSALRNIRLVCGDRVAEEEILRHLRLLGLEEQARQPVEQLSGGQRRRVALARAVLYGGDALILDEGFQGLDATRKQAVMEYVRDHRAGRTLLLVTHDPAEAAFFGGQLIELK